MKRSLLLLSALGLVIFGALLALDVINFEEGLAGETSQIDRWTMIFSFGAAVAFIGLARADTSASEDTAVQETAAEEAAPEMPDIDELPVEPVVLAIDGPVEAGVSDTAALFKDDEPKHEIVAVPAPAIDPVDAELQSLIDEDQMQEINELVAAADAAADIDLETGAKAEIVPGSETVEPLARLELRLADYNDDDLKRVVKESETVVISEMVRSGQLTSEGELTQKDIASMVFLAYTSDEMLTELRLRKSLDETQPGLDASTGSDFAPLKNIE